MNTFVFSYILSFLHIVPFMAWKMAQWLTSLTILLEDRSLSPSTHVGKQTNTHTPVCKSNSRDSAPSPGLFGHYTQIVLKHTYRQIWNTKQNTQNIMCPLVFMDQTFWAETKVIFSGTCNLASAPQLLRITSIWWNMLLKIFCCHNS